jgi:hypothetical protein
MERIIRYHSQYEKFLHQLLVWYNRSRLENEYNDNKYTFMSRSFSAKDESKNIVNWRNADFKS